MKFAILNNNIVENIIECELEYGFEQGYIYIGEYPINISDKFDAESNLIITTMDGVEKTINLPTDPRLPLAKDCRKYEYSSMFCRKDGTPLIMWDNTLLTVDGATALYLSYFSEDNPKAEEIKLLIIDAKAYIRQLYPDMT